LANTVSHGKRSHKLCSRWLFRPGPFESPRPCPSSSRLRHHSPPARLAAVHPAAYHHPARRLRPSPSLGGLVALRSGGELGNSIGTTYIVAATPRTGSNLLCGGLIRSQVAGNPQEYFEPENEAKWRADLGVSMEESYERFVEAAKRYGTRGDVYGMKIHWCHVADLARNAGFRLRPEDVLEHYFAGAMYINIIRRDRLAQALSWFRAIETNEWFRLGGAAPPVGPPRLDPDAVSALVLDIERQQSEWMRYFHEHGINALTVQYEELVTDRRGQIARVLAFLGRDPAAAAVIPDPFLTRQADEVTERWRDAMQHAPGDRT
jgi:trehalose 2-sulfotransferase